MIIAPCTQLPNNLLVNSEQRLQFPLPSYRLRMIGITLLFLSEYVPHCVEFIVLTEKVVAA